MLLWYNADRNAKGGASHEAEAATVTAMEEYAKAQGYELDFSQGRFHHEIYLSDARRCRPERLKTVIRQPVRRIT